MKKHIIIIEGPDNTGKDTLMRNLQNKLGDGISYHFSSPPNSIPKIEKLKYQYNNWIQTWSNTKKSIDIGNINYGIWNRSHLGEYLYGPMYRNIPQEVVLKKIIQFEDVYLKPFFNTYKFHVIVLIPDIDTVIKNDDGLSHSIDKNDKIKEIETFKTFNEITLIEDVIIYNVCDENGNFKDPHLIRDDILNRLDINS